MIKFVKTFLIIDIKQTSITIKPTGTLFLHEEFGFVIMIILLYSLET